MGQSSSSNFKVLATETIDLFDNDVIEVDYSRDSGSSAMSSMNHSNQMLGSMTSQGSYGTGSVQRNLQQSSQRLSMPRTSQFKSASSVSESKPKIGFLDSEFTEAGNSNTVFIQHRGSAASNGMLNSGSSGRNGIQNQGSSSNGMRGTRYESAGY